MAGALLILPFLAAFPWRVLPQLSVDLTSLARLPTGYIAIQHLLRVIFGSPALLPVTGRYMRQARYVDTV